MKHQPKIITRDGVERILATVKLLVDVPSQSNNDLLRQELDRCRNSYVERGVRLTEKILRRLRKLKHLLHELRDDDHMPWRLLGEKTISLLKSDEIAKDLDRVLTSKNPTPRMSANALELMVGQDLPFAFKGFFGRHPSYSENRAFAQAVLREMGIHYSVDSIDRAFADGGRRRPERSANKKRKQVRAAVRTKISKTAG